MSPSPAPRAALDSISRKSSEPSRNASGAVTFARLAPVRQIECPVIPPFSYFCSIVHIPIMIVVDTMRTLTDRRFRQLYRCVGLIVNEDVVSHGNISATRYIQGGAVDVIHGIVGPDGPIWVTCRIGAVSKSMDSDAID